MKKSKFIIVLIQCFIFFNCNSNFSKNAKNIEKKEKNLQVIQVNNTNKKIDRFTEEMPVSTDITQRRVNIKKTKKYLAMLVSLLPKFFFLKVTKDISEKTLVSAACYNPFNITLQSFIESIQLFPGQKYELPITIGEDKDNTFKCINPNANFFIRELHSSTLPKFMKFNETSSILYIHPKKKGVWDILIDAENPTSKATTYFTVIVNEKFFPKMKEGFFLLLMFFVALLIIYLLRKWFKCCSNCCRRCWYGKIDSNVFTEIELNQGGNIDNNVEILNED